MDVLLLLFFYFKITHHLAALLFFFFFKLYNYIEFLLIRTTESIFICIFHIIKILYIVIILEFLILVAMK
jgi:hypothetical protein